MSGSTADKVRAVLADTVKLGVGVDDLGEDTDLYQVGLSSHASVNLMLALEDTFGVEFPNELLHKATFGSIAAIQAALTQLGAS
jgi:acyl carrier protein